MNEVLEYLSLKNHYFEHFFTITSKFIEKAGRNEWSGLERLVDNRDRILNIIRTFDYKIGRRLNEIEFTKKVVNTHRKNVEMLLEKRDSIVKSILEIDLILTSKIDELKSDSIRELKKNQEASQQFNSFSMNAGPRRRKPQSRTEN